MSVSSSVADTVKPAQSRRMSRVLAAIPGSTSSARQIFPLLLVGVGIVATFAWTGFLAVLLFGLMRRAF